MTIGELVKKTDVRSITGNKDIQIRQIRHHSEKVERGDVFVALRGIHLDGNKFIPRAIERGAAAIVHEGDMQYSGVVDIQVKNSQKALAVMADRSFDSPASHLTIVGITGTNGKTTISYLVKQILETAGFPCGLIGTINYQIGNEIIEPIWTTPEALELHHLLSKMRNRRMRCVVMEVSSHALKQDRVYGIQFSVAVFSNLTRDHLDYHQDMEDYRRSKEILFEQIDPLVGWGISNLDDPVGEELARKSSQRFITYSTKRLRGDVYPEVIEITAAGINGTIETPNGELEISSPLLGEFNVSNILAAIGTGIALEIEPEAIVEGIEQTSSIPGRFEKISKGQPFNVIVDYAHAPDSVDRALEAARKISKGRIIALLGCGGDRDPGKRNLMGNIAANGADIAVITSDNPRTEDPEKIIDEIFHGILRGSSAVRISDRKAAIEHALSLAKPNDTVIILGKGHENYQVIGSKRVPFNDREIAGSWIEKHCKNPESMEYINQVE